jgi:hypothetical protein
MSSVGAALGGADVLVAFIAPPATTVMDGANDIGCELVGSSLVVVAGTREDGCGDGVNEG